MIEGDLSFSLEWPNRAESREALVASLGRLAPHLMDALRSYPNGWGVAFNPGDMVISQRALNGDHWADWLATDCPALVVRGSRSSAFAAEHAVAMVSRRPHTSFVELAAGHVVHDDQPAAFAAAVHRFLSTIGARREPSTAKDSRIGRSSHPDGRHDPWQLKSVGAIETDPDRQRR